MIMKCRECPDYAECVKKSNLKIKRKTCKKAKEKYVMTNADLIRAMSDEELAEVFCNADWCNACGQLKQDGTCRAMEMGGKLDTYCKAGCLTWLRQSAAEEAK